MMTCPNCGRAVAEKRTCMYCGALLTTAPAAIQGLNADQWVAEGVRVLQMNQAERARRCFDNALTIAPTHPQALFNSALLHARSGDTAAALRVVRQLLALTPDDAEARRLEAALEADHAAVDALPAGRPWKSFIAMVSEGGPPEAWIAQASAAVHGELGIISGPEAIAAVNWVVDLPPSPMSIVGRPYWNVADFAQRGVICHLVAKDRTAVSLRYHDQGPRMDDATLSQAELEAFGLFLHAGVLARVVLGGRFPWPERTAARVAEVNRRLDALKAAAGARVKLVVVPVA